MSSKNANHSVWLNIKFFSSRVTYTKPIDISAQTAICAQPDNRVTRRETYDLAIVSAFFDFLANKKPGTIKY